MVINLTQGIAIEMAPNARVNCVCPVSAATKFDCQAMGQKNVSEEMEKKVGEGIPVGRRATPRNIAVARAFLASEDAGFLTAFAPDIRGGRSIQ
ncbi:MAG: NAD(P)-dependent dehydrogenase (short-subunit alcohol dehydrogenase family) [Candidatus Azotimanducaceae bacterium]|jgi:NAD(P)-dependent dehydrogenase (short-subunit alcohol dehydrogenase family)